MVKSLRFSVFGSAKNLLLVLTMLLLQMQGAELHAQGTEVYNDAGVRLRVWLHAVYADANCSENAFSGATTKFVYNNLRVRASGGPGFQQDNFPPQNLLNVFAQDMRFRTSGRTNRFWRVNDGQFRMQNPYYPFERSTFPVNSTYIADGQLEAAPNAISAPLVPVGSQLPATQGYLLFDRTFSGNKAPDRYQWFLGDAFESDADISADEAGGLALFGLGCTRAFGLPQVYEGSKGTGNYDPLLTLLMLDSLGIDLIAWALGLGGCTNIFGIGIDPLDLLAVAISAVINDYDDSYGNKRNWSDDPAFFRGTSANEVGYFTTRKVLATQNRDADEEGYILVFAHQWEWATPNFPEPTGVSRIQAELCPSQQYTDGPMQLQVWLDGYFTDSDHEGGLGGPLQCFDNAVGDALLGERLYGNEEKYIRGRARTQFTGMPGWSTTIRNNQNRPQWINVSPATAGAQLLNYNFTETGMNTFTYELESWESDCWTESPGTCRICILGGDPNGSPPCCQTSINIPFVGEVCVWPPLGNLISIPASDFDRRATATATVNWRNSPPNTDNFVYVPIQLSTSQYQSHLARLRYRWTIANPVAGTVDGARDIILCPGVNHTMTVTGSTNATWYQWQYAEVEGPAGPACPSGAIWIDIPGAICPTYTTPAFTGTRVYRLKVFNRNGDGSKTPNGEKFAESYTVCTRITVLNNIIVPIDSPLECGTSGSPTPVRAGSSISLRPVLPPAPGSIDIPGSPPIRYTWAANNGGTVNPDQPVGSPWQTTVTFPTTSPTVVRVRMTTVVDERCPTATNRSFDCFYVTEDPGCSGITGVIYVSPTAPAGGIGTINRPYRIAEAFAAVASSPEIKHVKLLEGTYTLAATLRQAMLLTDSLLVEGNYVEEFDATLGENIWVKRSDAITNITSNIREQISPDILHTIGFRAVGDNWTLHDINITTGPAPIRTGPAILGEFGEGRGFSNYAIHINNSTGWRMINVNAQAGQGGRGSQPGTPQAENCPDATNPPNTSANAPPSGISNNNFCPPRGGGDGGLAGATGQAAPVAVCPAGCGGSAGNNDGNQGLAGANGNVDAPFGSQVELWGMSYFTPKGQNMANVGQDGSGGGGGGGGPASRGGAGGIGGKGGIPGWGSGGAFAIWISGGSTGSRRNTGTTLVNATGVLGGPGGLGMPGYPGGNGGAGAGNGGPGGTGGAGGVGSQGFNQDLYVDNTSNLSSDIPSNPYPPTRVESDYASGCTNSRIVIRKAGGVWGGLGGLGAIDYPEINNPPNSPVSTTEGVAAPEKLIYFATGNLGPKNLNTGAEDYFNQLYIRFDRPAPTTSLPSQICSGTPVDFTATSGLPDPIDHEWVVQEVISGARPTGVMTSPAPVIVINSIQSPTGVMLPANTTTGNKVYQVRYRVRDNCCGWSIPVYRDITVIPEINNVLALPDTVLICDAGDPAPILNNALFPLPSGGTWQYEWFESFNGGPFTLIPGATASTYDPPVLGTVGSYQFVRVIRSTVAACADTSNPRTIIVTENFQDNFINFPVPFSSQCNAAFVPPTWNSGNVSTNNTDIGSMTGSVPVGPGTPSTIFYQWQFSTDSVTWTNATATWPTQAGAPTGTGSLAQNWDPGIGTPLSNYAVLPSIFGGPGQTGIIYFRRQAAAAAGDLVCRTNSNVVFAEVISNAQNWNVCPTDATNSTRAACLANYPPTTALEGYYGTCEMAAPDTVCPGESVQVTLQATSINGIRAFGDRFAWFIVPGGPYNFTSGLGNTCTNIGCSNPMLNSGCANPKPLKADFLTYQPYDTNGTSLSYVMDSTTTFYVNSVGRCFDEVAFTSSASPQSYNQIGNAPNRWLRRTVVTVTPIEFPTDLLVSDSLLCGDITPPDIITLTAVGGTLGNDGRFVYYDTDPTVGGPHTPIFEGFQRDASDSARIITIPRPANTTTYYVRIENRCTESFPFSVTVTVVEPPVAPTDLTGPDIACGGESVSLTVVGGSLTPGSQWVLYNGDPTSGGTKLDSNSVGSFTQTPVADITYYVRAEAPFPCLASDAVLHFVEVLDTCVCDANPGTIEYAPSGVLTVAPVECEDSDGWTWYATVANPTEYLFGIQKRPTVSNVDPSQIPGANTNDFSAIVSIFVSPNPATQDDVFFAQDLPTCEGNFVMPRYWNVNVDSGTVNGFVKTRFFFPPAELAATIARANTWRVATQPSCVDPLTTGPTQVFKNTDATFFDPGPVTAINVPVNPAVYDLQPTTINNFVYVGYLFSSLPFGAVGTMDGKNYVEVAWDGFSGGGVAVRVSPDITVLPVTLVSFTGSLIDDYVQLNWETASEFNNDFFQVEKSQDGRNFFPIGVVPGAGTTTVPQFYDLVDPSPYIGDNYYRLKQVDFDGSFEYSRTIVVNVGGPVSKNGFIGVYPNPTEGWVRASISSMTDQNIYIKIMDVTGREMTTKNVNLGKGINNIDLDLGFYPAGSYILSFTDSMGMEHNVKLIKQN
jgi:hypothetical protein